MLTISKNPGRVGTLFVVHEHFPKGHFLQHGQTNTAVGATNSVLLPPIIFTLIFAVFKGESLSNEAFSQTRNYVIVLYFDILGLPSWVSANLGWETCIKFSMTVKNRKPLWHILTLDHNPNALSNLSMKKIGNKWHKSIRTITTLHLIKHLKLEMFLNAATVKGRVPGCRKGSVMECVHCICRHTWIWDL